VWKVGNDWPGKPGAYSNVVSGRLPGLIGNVRNIHEFRNRNLLIYYNHTINKTVSMFKNIFLRITYKIIIM
jgi:hypothetical protein